MGQDIFEKYGKIAYEYDCLISLAEKQDLTDKQRKRLEQIKNIIYPD